MRRPSKMGRRERVWVAVQVVLFLLVLAAAVWLFGFSGWYHPVGGTCSVRMGTC